jgi:protein-tyrosine-phosphatase
MKILFICKSNFGRSQIAETLFNSKSKKHTATSAGTENGRVIGHKLGDFPEHSNLFTCMEEIGFDIRNNTSKLLTPDLLKEADRVYVMAEKETWPDYLKEESQKVTFWDIEDMCGQSIESFRKGRDQIAQLIDQLLAEIE